MSDTEPGICRSNDCGRPATLFLSAGKPSKWGANRYGGLWHGEFCHEHAMRALDLKVKELGPGLPELRIERVVWVMAKDWKMQVGDGATT